MQANATPLQAFPILQFLGIVVQLGGAALLTALFVLLRRFVLRRAYFNAWVVGWGAITLAILALFFRYVFVPQFFSAHVDDRQIGARALYFVYQAAKGVGFVYFLRGTLTYVAGQAVGSKATRGLWIGAVLFALVSTVATRHGLNEMAIWQSLIAIPALGYCASALLWLPRPRRTAGSTSAGVAFGLLALLWLAYAGAFSVAIRGGGDSFGERVRWLLQFNSYFDLALDLVLGYAMIRMLMEDSKREMDDAQAELRVTHDRLRRAALYDSLTETLNRRAFDEGVGLEMVRATFGAVVIADIDNLKLANDRYGHVAGDQLIRRCADVLRCGLRQYDKLYRWGGDEFLIVLPSARASDVLERLRLAIAEADPVVRDVSSSRSITLCVSLGASDYSSSAELPAAIERADDAMYQDKNHRKSDPAYAVLEGAATPVAMPIA
jgi:diguanylate cyclase (GGDEF)-like protein